MALKILTVDGKEQNLVDGDMEPGEFWSEYFHMYDDRVELDVIGRDGSAYSAIFMKQNIVSVQEIEDTPEPNIRRF